MSIINMAPLNVQNYEFAGLKYDINSFTPTDNFRLIQNNEWKSQLAVTSISVLDQI